MLRYVYTSVQKKWGNATRNIKTDVRTGIGNPLISQSP